MEKIKQLINTTKTLNILYVEDEKYKSVELYKNYFNKIDVAVDGIDGLNKYLHYYKTNKKYYDIVISDLSMPKMNGIEMSKNILQKNPTQNIIIVSAHNESEQLEKLMNMGIIYYLRKPLELELFNDILLNIINKSKLQ